MKRNLLVLTLVALLSPLTSWGQNPKIKAERWLTDLEAPVWLTHDGTQRLILVEQRGRVRLIEYGQMHAKPYLDIVSKVRYQGEMGLLSVIFHPKFAENGYVYANYTRQLPPPPPPADAPPPQPGARRGRGPQGQIQTVIAEYKVDPKADQIDPTTERIVMTINQPYSNHNGGQLLFGPDGMLYIGMGDGGAANDPQNRAQNPQELLGKVLRIDVTPREGYAVPSDNPFVGKPEYRPEIWALGVRNPWRMAFDRQPPHLLYAGEVGQNLW
jgi:glucose/arabinose dehydrogenase